MRIKMILLTTLTAASIVINPIVLANEATANNSAAIKIYTQDKQNIIATPTNSEFTIKLKSNPTTGYSWFLREYDANLIAPVRHSFEAPNKNLMGAPGFELWTFKVKPEGFAVPQQTLIRLIYARPWQGADNSSQVIFRVTTVGK